MFRLFSLFTLLISFGCNKINTIENNVIGNNKYSILKYNPKDHYYIFKDAVPAKLSKKEIFEIEKIIFPKISETITSHNVKLNSKDNYSRQYLAVINSKNEKIVWIQFYCGEVSNKDLKSYALNVSDGGDCIFKIKVNLSNKTFYDYSENMES
jgi:hypothetical protein